MKNSLLDKIKSTSEEMIQEYYKLLEDHKVNGSKELAKMLRDGTKVRIKSGGKYNRPVVQSGKATLKREREAVYLYLQRGKGSYVRMPINYIEELELIDE